MNDGTEGSNLDDEARKESAKILPLTNADVTSSKDELTSSENEGESDLVTARGTGDGLVLRLDGRASQPSLLSALKKFVGSRKGFLEGNKVSLEWVSGVPEDSFVNEVKATLKDEFKVHVASSMLWEASSRPSSKRTESPARSASTGSKSSQESLNLFSGIDALEGSSPSSASGGSPISTRSSGDHQSFSDGKSFGESVWDDPDARVVYATLRSGQKVETEHTLVIVGDVNSGAELVAGGDIIVLGTLRGVAHAGAYDESGGGRFICALSLQPTQLRIGVVISRGGATRVTGSSPCPEIARVEGNNIIVEPYSPRLVRGRMS